MNMILLTTPRGKRFGRATAAVLLSAIAVVASAAGPASVPPSTQPALSHLADQIARGTPDEAAAAADEFVRQIVEPVAAVLKNLEQRSQAEQRRVLQALQRVHAALRIRLYQANLPPEDAQLFDQVAAGNRDLLERLFDDDPRRRLAALYQIPLEPGSAAGVLVTSRLFDWDALVVEAALKIAARLGDDPATMRGLERFVDGASQAVCGTTGALPADEAAAWADFSNRAICLLGNSKARSSVPVIVEAIRCFGRPPYRTLFRVAETLDALGKIGDERAVPLLLECTTDTEQHAVRSLGAGSLLRVTVGDAALLALARIYGLPPDELGFVSAPGDHPVTGFLDERTRRNALRLFALWYKENGEKPPQERTPLIPQATPTTEPAAHAPAEQP